MRALLNIWAQFVCIHASIHNCLCLRADRASAGHMVLMTNLVLGARGMEIVDTLVCSSGKCPTSQTAKATRFDMKAQQMCYQPPTTKPPVTTTKTTTKKTTTKKTTTTTTKKIGPAHLCIPAALTIASIDFFVCSLFCWWSLLLFNLIYLFSRLPLYTVDLCPCYHCLISISVQ